MACLLSAAKSRSAHPNKPGSEAGASRPGLAAHRRDDVVEEGSSKALRVQGPTGPLAHLGQTQPLILGAFGPPDRPPLARFKVARNQPH